MPSISTVAPLGSWATPTDVRATPGDGSAAVSWNAGTSLGAPATTGYQVTATATGQTTRTCTSTVNPPPERTSGSTGAGTTCSPVFTSTNEPVP